MLLPVQIFQHLIARTDRSGYIDVQGIGLNWDQRSADQELLVFNVGTSGHLYIFHLTECDYSIAETFGTIVHIALWRSLANIP